MFKNTSSNMESRARRTVVECKKNVGVDPTAFKTPIHKDWEMRVIEATNAKKDIETELIKINAHITKGLGARARTGMKTPADIWTGWQKRKVDLVIKLREAEKHLASVKLEGRDARRLKEARKQETYDAAFKLMAKQLLAPDVYDRIVTAAIHRLSDEGAELPDGARHLQPKSA